MVKAIEVLEIAEALRHVYELCPSRSGHAQRGSGTERTCLHRDAQKEHFPVPVYIVSVRLSLYSKITSSKNLMALRLKAQ